MTKPRVLVQTVLKRRLRAVDLAARSLRLLTALTVLRRACGHDHVTWGAGSSPRAPASGSSVAGVAAYR
eukprot:3057079-Rhodomonas_salina.1